MVLKNSFNFVSEFLNYSLGQIRRIYLSSKFYNKKISKIDNNILSYKPSPSILNCLIKYEKKKNNIEEEIKVLDFVRALNKVDFPTLGSPTIPHWRAII